MWRLGLTAAIILAGNGLAPVSTAAPVQVIASDSTSVTRQIDPDQVDRAAWNYAQELNTADAFEAYLLAFPEGRFRQDAEARLAALRPKAVPQPQPQASPNPEQTAVPQPARPSLFLVTPQDGTCAVCPRVVRIPGGDTVLGSEVGGAEGPRTPQTLRPFRISAAEITVGEVRRFEEATGQRLGRSCFVWTEAGRLRSREGAYWGAPGYEVTDAHPAACVSWDDAQLYVDWLNASDPRGGWRLPSEAEFEYAARGSLDQDYPWSGGVAAICDRVNGAGAESRFRHRNTACSDGTEAPVPAGGFPINPYGLSHMLGNLWEWTADCWNGSHRGAAPDGAARTEGTCSSRVLRGGSWDDPPENLRVSYRVGIPKTRRQANVGFRVARDDVLPE